MILSLSNQTLEFAQTRAEQLQKYLNAVFQCTSVRNNTEALLMLNIHQTVHPIPRARLEREAFSQPLLALSYAERFSISSLYVYITESWPPEMNSMLVNLMKKLKLPESAVTEQMLHQVSVIYSHNYTDKIRDLLSFR